MANLFEINREITDLYEQMIDPETGEVNETIYAAYDALNMERDKKINNIACWIKNLNSDAEQIEAEAKAMSERAKSCEKKAESLKRYLMATLNGEKFKSVECSISWRKTKAVDCNLEDLTVLPERFLRYKDPELNKTEVKAALENGEKVDGCVLYERLSMSIK